MAYILHSMCAPGETPGHEGAPAFPSARTGGVEWWLSRLVSEVFLGFRHTHKHEACPGPALPYQACSLTLCAVCVDLASLTVHLMFCALSQRHFRAFRRRKLNHPPVHSRSFSPR